jgi:hypothetical protein
MPDDKVAEQPAPAACSALSELEAKRQAIRTFRAATTLLERLPHSVGGPTWLDPPPAKSQAKAPLVRIRQHLDAMAFLSARDDDEVVAYIPLGSKLGTGEFFELAATHHLECTPVETAADEQASPRADDQMQSVDDHGALHSKQGIATANVAKEFWENEATKTSSTNGPSTLPATAALRFSPNQPDPSQFKSASSHKLDSIFDCKMTPCDIIADDPGTFARIPQFVPCCTFLPG